MKINKISFLVIILVSVFLRAFMLSSVPNGFFSDEASYGYNAYSLMLTAHDRDGRFLPMLLRSFDDHILPVFNYSIIPSVFLFGLKEFSVRIVSAFYGVLAVIFTYLLTKKIFNEKIALFASLFLAISPWHIQFSRYGHPAIPIPALFLIGLYFLYKGLDEKKYLILSSIFFALCFHTYAISGLFVPLFLIGFLVIYRNKLRNKKREIFIGIALILIIIMPIVYSSFRGEELQKRFSVVSIFSEYKKPVNEPLTLKEISFYFKSFFDNYFRYFSFDYLFLNGDSEKRHSIEGFGQLYLFHLPLLLIGLFLFLKKRTMHHKLLLWWLLIYPVAASLTTGVHAIRSISALPLFQIISAYSVGNLLDSLKLRKRFIIGLFLVLISLLAVYNIGSYMYNYFIEYPRYSAASFQYGKKEAVYYLESVKRDYNKVVVPEEDEIFILFYSRFNPREYQANKLRNTRYDFCFIRECCLPEKNNLCWVKPDELNDFRVETKKMIYYPDGRPAYRIVG